LRRIFRLKRDYYAGALMVLVGLVTAHDGTTIPIGTLRQMGPGYFPVALGVLLIFLGILIAGNAGAAPAGEHRAAPREQGRGWLCIVAGPVLFILCGKVGGMLPATFACVFVSALGDRETTLKQAAVLAAGVTAFGIVLFAYLLKIPMPILTWDWP
jgi:putative tricarboxylic transport membrane protein